MKIINYFYFSLTILLLSFNSILSTFSVVSFFQIKFCKLLTLSHFVVILHNNIGYFKVLITSVVNWYTWWLLYEIMRSSYWIIANYFCRKNFQLLPIHYNFSISNHLQQIDTTKKIKWLTAITARANEQSMFTFCSWRNLCYFCRDTITITGKRVLKKQ